MCCAGGRSFFMRALYNKEKSMQRMKTLIRIIAERVRDRRGFSLMDIIVATAIIAMITSISINYNHSTEEQLRVFKSQALITGAINRAKSFAAERYIGKNVPVGSFACAFGVHFDTVGGKVVIFEDIKPSTTIFTCLNADGSYSPSQNVSGGFFNSPSETIEEVPLDSGVALSLPNGGADVIFIPPDLSASTTGTFPVIARVTSASGKFGDVSIINGGQVITK